MDLGCGFGAQSLRLGVIGFSVTMVDIIDISESVRLMNRVIGSERLKFLRRDTAELSDNDIPDSLDILYSQRFIHYLKFGEALRLLGMLSKRLKPGARLFVSASGLHSELGQEYPHRELPIESRFAPLAPSMAEKHQIREAVCLYEETDLARASKILKLDTITVFRSSFGNIKGVFAKP